MATTLNPAFVVAEPIEDDSDAVGAGFFVGVFWAVIFSIPFWAVIYFAARPAVAAIMEAM